MGSLCAWSRSWGPLAGRILIAIIFIHSGIGKIFGWGQTLALMQKKGVPFAELALFLTILIVLGGALMLIIGWKVEWAAAALFLWMIPVTLVFHAFWVVPPEQVFNQTNHFLKNVAIMGALLLLVGMGSGPRSVSRFGPPAG